jgi:hypothetical protein
VVEVNELEQVSLLIRPTGGAIRRVGDGWRDCHLLYREHLARHTFQPDTRVYRGRSSMDWLESDIHSFIVKIWLEECTGENGEALWRGHITHVPDKRRRYLNDLQDISSFIEPYLHRIGVEPENSS